MKRTTLYGALSTVATTALLSNTSMAATYFVSPSGNDAAAGTSAGTSFKTVARAAQKITAGDKLILAPGLYRDSAEISGASATAGKRIEIIGDENGKLSGRAAGAVVLEPKSSTDSVLRVSGVNGLTVTGLTVRGSGQGISLSNSRDVIVERSTFDGVTKGIAAQNSENVRLESSVFSRCTIAASLQNCTRTRVAHVTIASANSVGLLILGGGSGTVRNSLFANNSTNFVADQTSYKNWSSDHNVISGPNGPWGPVPVVNYVYEWSAASGQDRNSVHVTPAFVKAASYDLRIDPTVTWGGGLPGMNVGATLEAKVTLDRSGKPFRVRNGGVSAGAYDYPDPQPGPGWKRLNAKLPGGPRQAAGIYRADGTLVRTLLADAAGVSDLWWDGRDDLGQAVPAGQYQVRAITHNVRMLDDGAIGDNGDIRGGYHSDNPDRVLALPDGGFIVTAIYDEASIAWRRYSPEHLSVFGSALEDTGFWGLARHGDNVISGLGKGADTKLVQFRLPGERIKMANGADNYAIVDAEEKNAEAKGVAVSGTTAYVSLAGLNVVRSIDLTTGKKIADWPVAAAGDIARSEDGTLWAISGKEIVSFTGNGQIDKRYSPGLNELYFLAAGKNRLAAVDRLASRVAILDSATGKVTQTLGQDRTKEYFLPVSGNVLRDPRGAAFLPDGRLLLTEHGRTRIVSPENPTQTVDMVSNFMETAVVHPTRPDIVYAGAGAYRVDPKTGAWSWVVETPAPPFLYTKENDPWRGQRHGSPGQALMLGGRPFISYFNGAGDARLVMMDVSDPLKPRLALDYKNEHKLMSPWAYNTITFTKGGDIVVGIGQGYDVRFQIIPFKGLDAQNNPTFDWENKRVIGYEKDPSPRGMKHNGGLSADRTTGDIYYMAVTNQHNKMVPAWGADGTGVGKTSASGEPQWFALSSGGNYTSLSTINDGKNAWTFGGKSFGGQLDVFDQDGLRVTTGNWSEPSGYQIGFVDLRYGVHAYIRPDGKPGAYVEDDAIGRFARARLDGAQTLRRHTFPINWSGGSTVANVSVPRTDVVEASGLTRGLTIPKVAPMKVDGDWAQWQTSGVQPQMTALPSSVGFKRLIADDLLQTFREGTFIGALAHDGSHLYAYVLASDDTPQFNAPTAADMWKYDGFEFWVEEEQFGLGMTKDGTPSLWKWRFHNLEGKQWSANYGFPREYVWAQQIKDLSSHPLGAQLASVTGVSFKDKPGFAVMAKIPFNEIKLVGGVAGRPADKDVRTTALEKSGDLVRITVSLNNISAWGRMQDYQVDWPVGKMFSDASRSYPFVLE